MTTRQEVYVRMFTDDASDKMARAGLVDVELGIGGEIVEIFGLGDGDFLTAADIRAFAVRAVVGAQWAIACTIIGKMHYVQEMDAQLNANVWGLVGPGLIEAAHRLGDVPPAEHLVGFD